jgi:cytochrome c peroxidase
VPLFIFKLNKMIVKAFYSLTLVALLSLLSSEYSEDSNFEGLSDEILLDIKHDYLDGLDNFKSSVDHLYDQALAFQDDVGRINDLRKAVSDSRLAFKEIEFLIEYYDHEAVKRSLNGPPLPSLEPAVAEIVIWEPNGLQTIDEIVFSDLASKEKEYIFDLARQLKRDVDPIYTFQRNIILEHRKVFEAIREELNRVYTLGLTGFDTPGSAQALPETAIAMRSMMRAISHYEELFKSKNQEILFEKTTGLFKDAFTYIDRNNSFDTFDRMHFLREYINPLFELTYQLHKSSGIETISEAVDIPLPVNYDATNLFSEDLLNEFFYAGVHESEFNEERIKLGKLLFFDPVLSVDNSLACASCHNPKLAFTDGQKKSIARGGHGHLKRNAPTLIDAVFAAEYFYDLRESDLLRQIKHVVSDSSEFNTSFVEIEEKLAGSSEYRALFEEAYGEYGKYQLTKFSISHALASYVLSLSSFNSEVDRYIRYESNQLDEEVIAGYNLFMGKAACGTCHFAPVFNGLVPPYYTESESEVLGVPATNDTINPILDPDIGRRGSYRPIDESDHFFFSFKTPTVRNVELTAPYMHNGVYESLEEVIDFYNKGGGLGLGIELEHQTLPFSNLNLNNKEIKALVKFMEALTDTSGMTSQPHSLPVFDSNEDLNARTIGGLY